MRHPVLILLAILVAAPATREDPGPPTRVSQRVGVESIEEIAAAAGGATGTPFERTEFHNLYDGRLASLPSWSSWIELVTQLSPHAQKAFAGEVNLHAEALRSNGWPGPTSGCVRRPVNGD
jgi:hypothetical protein